jgi:hypothetical protein
MPSWHGAQLKKKYRNNFSFTMLYCLKVHRNKGRKPTVTAVFIRPDAELY